MVVKKNTKWNVGYGLSDDELKLQAILIKTKRKDIIDVWTKLINKGNNEVEKKQIIRTLCRVDRIYLASTILKIKPYIENDWLYKTCREVEMHTDGAIDLWARGHFKSLTITFVGIIQQLLIDPSLKVCIFSYSKEMAKKFFIQIKEEFENNESLKFLFDDIFYNNPQQEAVKWSNEAGITLRKHSGGKEPTLDFSGVVQSRNTGMHYNLRVYDDVVTDKSVGTGEQIELTNKSISDTYNLGTMNGVNREWWIGTRYHQNDSYRFLMDSGKFKVRVKPATDNGKLDGKPVFLSQDDWDHKKATSIDYVLSCQMLQNPIAGNSKLFNLEWLADKGYERIPDIMNIFILVDPASSKKKGSDKTSMAVVGVDVNGIMYLVDGIHDKLDLKQRWNALFTLYTKWTRFTSNNHYNCGVYVGYEKYGMQADIDYFKIEMERREEYFEIQELNWTGDGTRSKYDRIGRMVGIIKSGKFYIPKYVMKQGNFYKWKIIYKDDDWKFDIYQVKNKDEMSELKKLKFIGKEHLFAKPIKKASVNDEGTTYDYTLNFVDEYENCPFGKHDDILDSISRIFDMEMNLNPSVYDYRQNSMEYI